MLTSIGIIELCITIVTVGGAITMLIKVVMPAKKLIDRVDGLDERAQRDYKARLRQEEHNSAVTRALIAMLMHEMDGDSTGKMQAALVDLQQYLIDR